MKNLLRRVFRLKRIEAESADELLSDLRRIKKSQDRYAGRTVNNGHTQDFSQGGGIYGGPGGPGC
jgi:hypothetical protein